MSQTNVTIKIVNNTDHAFDVGPSSLGLTPAERDTIKIAARERTPLYVSFDYNYAYPWPNNKVMFSEFMDYSNQNVGFRLEFGLTMTKSFGAVTPTLKPNFKNRVSSIGRTTLSCSTRIIKTQSTAPFSFEVEFILG